MVVIAAAILFTMGRVPICTCGYVKVWHGVVASSENSQHISDWYTFSHVIHGFAFYGLFWLIGRPLGWSVGLRLVLAVTLESAWEILENTPLIINRYREATAALGYTGDSVLNSVSDIAMMGLGFLLARRLPVWVSVVIVLVLELVPLLVIRDNLTLNVWMLLAPNDALRAWQAGA